MQKKVIFYFQKLIFLCFILYFWLSIFKYFKKKKIVIKNKKIINNKNKRLEEILFKYKSFIKELPIYNHTHYLSNKIFWCWFQGREKAPNLIKACFNSVKRNCKEHEIIIITKKNIHQYVHIPSYILKKVQKKNISLTHFSDLLRLELIIKYGGTWIDSTVLITKYEPIFFNNNLFFFQSSKNKSIAGSNWFINAEKENPIIRTTLDMLYDFWARNDKICHYFLFHFFFKIACNKYEKDYKKVPFYSNKPVHLLQKDLFVKFKNLRYKHILNYASIHKLTRKHKTNITNGLVYHYILEKYSN